MSLDLYITSRTPIRKRGTGVYARENGQTVELKKWKKCIHIFLMQTCHIYRSTNMKTKISGTGTSRTT